ncbi:uncharacterized protein C8R40DRAFT_990175, partial [Lentinula edodes]|uniref:uncharacterized protein n=1 Tax=Lentinula edodes TaxID=5353 RepID=UPI001E8E007D
MTKMVNLLATKLELGSPMICLYLLCNPDHYGSHTFIPLYWSTFVTEARNTIVGLSSTFDYTHRPTQHEHIYLYDWIRRFKRDRKNSKERLSKGHELDCADSEIPTKEDENLHKNQLEFLKGHPLAASHLVRTQRNWESNVPNLIGGAFPRPDKGDREYYCSAVLTLFKPWRTGKDLKSENQTWHEAFLIHVFDEQVSLYIKNLNLRYECLDARDDYRSQLQ